jgi:hypothetical protein
MTSFRSHLVRALLARVRRTDSDDPCVLALRDVAEAMQLQRDDIDELFAIAARQRRMIGALQERPYISDERMEPYS